MLVKFTSDGESDYHKGSHQEVGGEERPAGVFGSRGQPDLPVAANREDGQLARLPDELRGRIPGSHRGRDLLSRLNFGLSDNLSKAGSALDCATVQPVRIREPASDRGVDLKVQTPQSEIISLRNAGEKEERSGSVAPAHRIVLSQSRAAESRALHCTFSHTFYSRRFHRNGDSGRWRSPTLSPEFKLSV
ncbi:hypothetical protein EVAR_52113_1 [Eumeta japonica]|uniref:Uncharacterized protein n=1 Tax=Eumeta variegata TaxID=151549 RepID=A0A4C1XT23_EUMVA|nr:hypothetical protein EVAR_52113_1 [Eumeta japonica]